jgi:type IV secretory pathway VirB10-like protein
MTSHLLEKFSEELTHTLQRRGSRCLEKEKLDTVLEDVEDAAVKTHQCPLYHGEHQTGICTASGDISFKFQNVPCEKVHDVISLGDSVWDETPLARPKLEPRPPPEPAPPAKSESEPEPVPESSPASVKDEEERLAKKEEEQQWLATEAEKEVERKKKGEEAAAAAAAAAATSAANDDWNSFAATTTMGKKTKGKKGKVRRLGYVMTYSRALTLA